jgi:chemotaxis protein MotB
MIRRRGIKHDEENTDRWLISYADFITLLFAFFVVMYSISSVNLGKYRVLSDSVSSAFRKTGGTDVLPGTQLGISVQRAPISLGTEGQAGYRAMSDTAVEIEKRMKDWINKGQIAVRGNEKWLEVEINTSILFGSGSAELSAPARDILTSLSDAFKGSGNPLYVAGYTDNVPISTVKYPSNWELSSARAASVVRLMAEAGIDPGRMGVIGFGEFRPITPNDNARERQKNRRVVIRILAGADMFSDSTPLAGVGESTPAVEASSPVTPALQLQPGEPARQLQ